jgi:nitric oxide reductase NorQ protein
MFHVIYGLQTERTHDRRVIPIDKLGTLLKAPPEFMLTISYNSGYQSAAKDLKQSTRQRFVAIDFDYPQRVSLR